MELYNRQMLNPDKFAFGNGAVIYGAGGHARELHDQMQADGWVVHAFVDDFDNRRSVDAVPVLSFEDACTRHSDASWFIALGDSEIRKTMAARLATRDLRPGVFVSTKAIVSPTARIEPGAQVFARTVVSSGVHLGPYVIVNFSCVLSHDVHIESFATLSPGVHIAGNVHVKEGALIGVGACVKNGSTNRKIKIGVNSVVGAGACVVTDVHDGTVSAGVPAKPLGKYNERRSH